MELEIKLICKRMIAECQTICDCTDDIQAVSGNETCVILEDNRLDALQHVQNLTLRLMDILADDDQAETPEGTPAEGKES